MKLKTLGLAAGLTLLGSFAVAQKSGVETTTGTIGAAVTDRGNGAQPGTSGPGINSSQADYNTSLQDSSASRTSDPNSTLVGAGVDSTTPTGFPDNRSNPR
jgi:hypothetical protein